MCFYDEDILEYPTLRIIHKRKWTKEICRIFRWENDGEERKVMVSDLDRRRLNKNTDMLNKSV
jgi:hypothetical protein